MSATTVSSSRCALSRRQRPMNEPCRRARLLQKPPCRSESRRAIELVGPMFRFAADGTAFVSEDANLSLHLRDALRVTAATPQWGGTLSLRWPGEGRTRLFVLASVSAVEPDSPAYVGFELSSAALNAWFREFIAAAPLLPRTLAAVAVIVTVRAPDGRAIFRAPDTDLSLPTLATQDLRGIPPITGLDGFTVEIAIAPAAASNLVIGGLPRSQTAFLLGLALLSAALAAAAALQIRRERRHADVRRDFVTARIARVAHACRAHSHVHRDAVARSCPIRRRASRNAAGVGSRRASLVDPDRQRAAAGELARRHAAHRTGRC